MTINTKKGEIVKIDISHPYGILIAGCMMIGLYELCYVVGDKVVKLFNRKKQKETK